ERGREEALAVGRAEQELARRLEAQREFGVRRAPEIAVVVGTDRGVVLDAPQHGNVELRIGGLHVAASGHRADVAAEAREVARREHRSGSLVELLLARFGAEREGKGARGQRIALARALALDALVARLAAEDLADEVGRLQLPHDVRRVGAEAIHATAG